MVRFSKRLVGEFAPPCEGTAGVHRISREVIRRMLIDGPSARSYAEHAVHGAPALTQGMHR
jgi:hypothetical protein